MTAGGLVCLIYYKEFDHIKDAKRFEYYLKGKSRANKERLISSCNPEFDDLSDEIGSLTELL